MREPITLERSREQAQAVTQTQGCCAPECGPDTCGSTPVADAPETQVSEQGCCDPECGPNTCG